jgi:transposase-like protein
MRYSASEKYEIIRLVEAPSLPIRQTLRQLDIGKSAFYSWLKRYQDNGIDGLEDNEQTGRCAGAGSDTAKSATAAGCPGKRSATATLRSPLDYFGSSEILVGNIP